MTVTTSDILVGLRQLGVGPGMGLMVHSSLKSFGRVDGGAETVVAALQTAVTATGTILMPSFNHGDVFRRDAPETPGYFDPHRSPTTNGALPSAFWQMPDVHRSWHPTHAFAAWGARARDYVSGHHRALTIGPGSPLGLLCREGGYGLLLGVDYRANTLHHLAEYIAQAPCLGRRAVALPARLPGDRKVRLRTWAYRATPCPIDDCGRYGAEMEARGLQRTATIGDCRAILFRLQDCVDVVTELLSHGYEDAPPCSRCPNRPKNDPSAVDSDWDSKSDSLQADSEAWGIDWVAEEGT